ncbi:MAG: EamA family transporter [Desulfobulbaceae bacterium]|nr:EamA family transporter [Desulfobulbaceae bacterium]
MFDHWLPYALSALIIYGLWGFFPKMAMLYIRPMSALVYEVAGALLVGLSCFFWINLKPETDPRGIIFSMLTGVCGMIGTLFFFAAADRGKISIIVSITALYPLITIILSHFILKEPIGTRQIIGMLLALAAILLLVE